MAFTNVDYNKDVMDYLDGNPYEAALTVVWRRLRILH